MESIRIKARTPGRILYPRLVLPLSSVLFFLFFLYVKNYLSSFLLNCISISKIHLTHGKIKLLLSCLCDVTVFRPLLFSVCACSVSALLPQVWKTYALKVLVFPFIVHGAELLLQKPCEEPGSKHSKEIHCDNSNGSQKLQIVEEGAR